MINIKTFVFNDFQENTFVLWDDTNKCIIVDPGCSTAEEHNILNSFFQEKSLQLEKVVNTHCHIDHILGVQYFVDNYKLPFYAHNGDSHLLENAHQQAQIFGLSFNQSPQINMNLEDHSRLTFGNSQLSILHVPGHSPGSIALYAVDEKFVIVGDVLFNGSIGRTDLPGGNYDTLINSIRTKLLALPGEVMVYPGHGPTTTINHEHDTNPFLR